MKDKETLPSVFQQYLNGKSKPEELDQILTDFLQHDDREGLKELIVAHLESQDEFDENLKQRIAVVVSHTDEKMKHFVSQRLEGQSGMVRRIRLWLPSAVAIVFVLLTVGLHQYLTKIYDSQERRLAAGASIGPIRDKATLTLADGSTIELSETQEGITVVGDNILYNDSSSVILGKQGSSSNTSDQERQTLKSASALTLTTPKGGRYRITLPDGTKVWLNAGSTLKYPSRFSGTERRVSLEGEAYFEVAHQLANHSDNRGQRSIAHTTKSPFIILSGAQEVKVLGTHFNISAYPDESEIRTTLVEGSVQVTVSPKNGEPVMHRILKPREQSIVTTGSKNITVRSVNTNDYTAWRESLLIFDRKSLKSILLTLSRWYDFQVDNTQIPDISLSGAIPANVKLSEVLALLEETSKVKLKIESAGKQGERRVTISR